MRKALLLALFSVSALFGHAQTTILSEGFNVTSRTGTFPTGWSTTGTGTNGYCVSTVTFEQVPSGGFVCAASGGGNPLPSSHTGTGMAGYNSWDISSGAVSELVTPALDFSGLGSTTLNVWIYQELNWNAGYDSLKIYVNTSPTSVGANSTLLYVGTPSYSVNNYWTLFTFNIPTTYTSNTNYIIFRGVSQWRNDIYFDDVEVIRNPPTACSGTPASPTISTAAIAAATPLCSGSTKTITAVDPNFPTISGTTYQWEESTTGTGGWTNVTGGTGGTTLVYTTPALTSTMYYRLGVKCVASGVTSYTGAYAVRIGAPQPSTIVGPGTFCPGDPVTYSVTNVTGTTYNWSFPSGWTGTSTTNSITVTPGSTTGTVSVTATTTCGTSIARNLSVSQGTAPGQPISILGSNTVCANSTQTYTTAAVASATSYIWTLPTGWVINGVATGNSISVTTSNTSGNVSVRAANGCGTSSVSVLPVTVVTSLASPGTITGTATPCAGALYTYSISPVPAAQSYQWVLPSGWSGTTTGTSIQVFPGSTGGTLTVTAYSPCATSPTSSLTTTVTPTLTPAVTLSRSDSQICQNTPVTFTATPTNGGATPAYVWKKNGSIVFGAGNTYIDNKLVSTDVITATLASSTVCRTVDSVVSAPASVKVTPLIYAGISISSTPVVNICAGAQVSFTTSVTGSGTTPQYQWYINSNPVVGANNSYYNTSTLSNSDTVTVQLTSSATCPYDTTVMSNKVVVKVDNIVTPTVTVSASTTAVVYGQTVTFTALQSGGGSTPGYQWIVNGVDVPGETSDIFTTNKLRGGDLVKVRLQSYDLCARPSVVTSTDVEMFDANSIARVGAWDGAISLYPNPNSGRFTVNATWDAAHIGKRVSVDVINMFGQTLYHSEVAPDKTKWSYDVRLADGMAAGHYTLRISSADGMRATVPFVLN